MQPSPSLSRARTPALALAVSLVVAACGADSAAAPVERAAITATTASSVLATTTTSVPTTTTAPTTTTTSQPPTVPLAPVPAAAGPGDLAVRIVAAEDVVRDHAAAPDRVAMAAFELQLLYRQLGREPGWEPEVLSKAPPHLQLSITANAAARREFRSMHSKLSDTLPAWRIVDPPPAADLLAYYQEGQATFGVPWEILAAVNLVETGMGRIRGTSVAGAQGPMQFMPATWAAFGEGDINDPHDAIMGAARYLAHNGGGRGDVDTALWNYNHSDKYVRGVKHYASVMRENPQAFHAFYHWQIVYLSAIGDIWMPTGFEQTDRIGVLEYLQGNPTHHLGAATG